LYDDCEKHEGQILIARLDDVMVGYAVVLAKVASTEEYEVDYVYGEVTDLMVTAKRATTWYRECAAAEV
jgi:hypothetical protein